MAVGSGVGRKLQAIGSGVEKQLRLGGEPAGVASDSGVQRALVAVGCADLLFLLVPLMLLTSAPREAVACGWTSKGLDSFCTAAILCLWFSANFAAVQLVALNAFRCRRQRLVPSPSFSYLVVPPLLGLFVGGCLGLLSLRGYSAIVHGDCGHELHSILGAIACAGFFLPLFHAALLMCRTWAQLEKVAGRPTPILPEAAGSGDPELCEGLRLDIEKIAALQGGSVCLASSSPRGLFASCGSGHSDPLPAKSVYATSSSSSKGEHAGDGHATGSSATIPRRRRTVSLPPQNIQVMVPDGIEKCEARAGGTQPHDHAASREAGRTSIQRTSLPDNQKQKKKPPANQHGETTKKGGSFFDEPVISPWSHAQNKGSIQAILGGRRVSCPHNTQAAASPQHDDDWNAGGRFADAFFKRSSVLSGGSPLKDADEVYTTSSPSESAPSVDVVTVLDASEGGGVESFAAPAQPKGRASTDMRGSCRSVLDVAVLQGCRNSGVVILENNPINFFSLQHSKDASERESAQAEKDFESSSSTETDSDESAPSEQQDEVWMGGGPQVAVPIWLLDRVKASGSAKSSTGTVQTSVRGAGGRRVSFHNTLVGHSMAEEECEGDGESQDTGLSKFWKIPMPTRAPTRTHSETPSRKQSDATGCRQSHIEGSEVQNRRRSQSQKQSAQKSRRQSIASALGSALADGETGAPGLYAAMTEGDGRGGGEVIEIRRKSLVMSPSMLNGIMDDRIFEKDEMSQLDEVVLPLFRPEAKRKPKMCNCFPDPVTGHMIHTCMTPATTNAENSVNQSYVCSAWNSTHASRRGSSRTHDDEVDSTGRDPTRKRVRNASMLEFGHNTRRSSAKKNTDETGTSSARYRPITEDSDEERTSENELAVSFANIQASRKCSILSDATPDLGDRGGQEGPTQAWSGSSIPVQQIPVAPKDVCVEDEIGRRFEMLEPEHLAALILDGERREQILVVDVRGRDWVGGHIPGSINLPTSEVVRYPASLLAQCHQHRIHHAIFTCMYSVLRARKCAIALESAQRDEHKTGHGAYQIRVSLLAGGMHAWINHFADKATKFASRRFVDGLDPNMWSDGGPSQGGLVHVMDALWSSGGQKALSDALTNELQSLAQYTNEAGSGLGSRRSSG